MKIILSQFVKGNEPGKWATLHKKVESNLIPVVGHFIEDSLWKEANEIVEVALNFEENYYFVTMKTVEFEKDARITIEEYVEMANLHGWKKPGELED